MPEEYKNIREPRVAGQFYPGSAGELSSAVKQYLNSVGERGSTGTVKAIMVPHAGYVFSGPVAAYGFKQLQDRKIGTVVIICNSHTAYFEGLAIDDHDAWKTPLGVVGIDKELADKLVGADDSVRYNGQAHDKDHTLEIQLPFLQTVLSGEFKIVPVLFGNTHDDGYKKLAKALADNLKDDDIVVISTDMSHYPSYDEANKIDRQTLEMIRSLDIGQLEKHMRETEERRVPNEDTLLCGIDGVRTVMTLYGLLDWDLVDILHYANSGDIPVYGDKERVVGYGAMVFGVTREHENIKTQEQAAGNTDSPGGQLNKQQKQKLLHIARTTVETFVRSGKKPNFDIKDERLLWREGAFVTLHQQGQLRGCIGQIIPSRKPLWEVVRDMAVSACSEDHRFRPVSAADLGEIDYEVSVLSVPEKINDWTKIELGKHGVIVRKGLFNSGVFLPQVATETGWSLEEFLGQLCSQKAGLPSNCYRDGDVTLEVFTAQVFGEK